LTLVESIAREAGNGMPVVARQLERAYLANDRATRLAALAVDAKLDLSLGARAP
jgi:hypothetical protein